MAYVFQRRKSWYGGWVDERGRPFKQRLPAATKTEAKRLADAAEQKAWRIRNGLEEAPKPDLTVSEGIALRLETLPQEYKTKKRQRELLAHVEKALGTRLLKDVLPLDVLKLLAALSHLSPQSREHVRMAGQGLYTFLTETAKSFTGDNPFKEAGQVDVPEREPGFFDPDQFTRLIEVMKPHLAAAALFSTLTGTRKAEVRKALKDDTHIAERYVLIRGPKNNKDRRVPIPEVLVSLLEQQLKTPGKYLFCRQNGAQYTNNWRAHDVIARACVRAGLIQGTQPYCFRTACGWKGDMVSMRAVLACPRCGRSARWKEVPISLRFKELRSTYATLGYATTGDIHFVQKVLGHSDPKLTQARYARALPEHLRRGANAVGAILMPTAKPGSPVGENPGAGRGSVGSGENPPDGNNPNESKGIAMPGMVEELRESARQRAQRFPKPQATGSIPVGVTAQVPGPTQEIVGPGATGPTRQQVRAGATWTGLSHLRVLPRARRRRWSSWLTGCSCILRRRTCRGSAPPS
ncbi:tyrosine-type recombinase/integrase [Corallococcus silvisoli]|uniref:tyrosine-type recombinase/integrase n=1 Tax=Corallococcus silvisoli TaxID=2697031 RepID=UPI001376E7AF|nr:tyrosine-type recombinase/integrase [Corallococcus silvisoli]NBD09284.1 tyrosine-type recombinase/integrase [Corallococcus silvisoli]